MSKKRVQEVSAWLVWITVDGVRYNPLTNVNLVLSVHSNPQRVKTHEVLLCRKMIVTDTVEEGDRVASEFQNSPEWHAMIADAQWELQQAGTRLEEWVDANEKRQWHVSTRWERYS
jgi:hypothetical protein